MGGQQKDLSLLEHATRKAGKGTFSKADLGLIAGFVTGDRRKLKIKSTVNAKKT